VAIAALAIALLSAPAAAAAPISLNDNAYLRLLHRRGAVLVEQGNAYGQARGRLTCRLRLGRYLTGTFQLSSGGLLTGVLSANRHRGRGGFESFGGSAAVVGRSGRFRRLRGTIAVYGVLDRRNGAVVLQLRGAIG